MKSALNFRNRRGSTLPVVMILTVILGGIIVPSMLRLSMSSLSLANRSHYGSLARDLAESGIEHGVLAVNQAFSGGAYWDGWEFVDNDAFRTFSGIQYEGSVTGRIEVCVRGVNSGTPVVIARGTIDYGHDRKAERWMMATMRTGRSLFASGMLARDTISASGGAYFDSWLSDPDNDPSTPPVPYHWSIARDNTRVASASTQPGAIDIGSADIYGSVAVGSATDAGLRMNWGGQVGPRGMPTPSNWNVAEGALTKGFAATFEKITAPEPTSYQGAYKLPYNKNGPPWYVDRESIGTPGGTIVVQMNSLTVEGAATLTIQGDVTVILPRVGVETLSIKGSGSIRLAPGAKLRVYTAGDIKVAGAGIVNPNAPARLQIWGTSDGVPTDYSIVGSGDLAAVIYSPDASLKIPGGANLYGAAVVNDVTMRGSGAFHYDESLKHEDDFSGGSLAVESVIELNTIQSRAAYAGLFPVRGSGNQAYAPSPLGGPARKRATLCDREKNPRRHQVPAVDEGRRNRGRRSVVIFANSILSPCILR